MSPSDPLPSIHRPDGTHMHAGAEEHGTTKGDAVEASKPEASKMSMADHHTSAAAEEHSTAVNPAFSSGATAGASSVDPGTGAAPGGEGMAATSAHEGHGADQQHEEAGSPKAASPTGAAEVMALQAFLQGGVLFIMAVTTEVFLLAPIGFGLGGISSSLDMLPVPVLQRYIEPDSVERQLGISRAASGIGCLLGPVLVMVFRDDEMKSYVVLFIVSGLLSLIAGALWLPGLKREMAEAHGKAAAPGTPEATAGAKPDVGEPAAAGEHSPPLPGALHPAAGDMAAGQSGSPEHAEAPGAAAVAPEAFASPPEAGGAPPHAPA
ncbi:hypothetical protein MTO96_032929 [Rhipicephalus appendiculatus]